MKDETRVHIEPVLYAKCLECAKTTMGPRFEIDGWKRWHECVDDLEPVLVSETAKDGSQK